MPQLPTTTVVTPCDNLGNISGMRITLVSSCVCTSMKPGLNTLPAPSITWSACQPSSLPTATMRPAATATSAATGSLPLPSITRALRISVSHCRPWYWRGVLCGVLFELVIVVISISERLTVAAAAMHVECILEAPQLLLTAILLQQRQFQHQHVQRHHHGVTR